MTATKTLVRLRRQGMMYDVYYFIHVMSIEAETKAE